jgi:NADPH:quinone reductase-like Zn-dependent oxidoreductase
MAEAAMKAITISEYGGPEVAVLREDVPVPRPGPDEVLVQVACAGINFMDVHTRQGKYRDSRTYLVRAPCTLGMEGAGQVMEVGSAVTHLEPGDRVAWCIAWGAYAEYAAVPARLAARIPDGIGYDQAAASMFQGCTAHYLLNDVAQLRSGDTCLVHAASGSIGQILVQMAHRAGITVFATASAPQRLELALQRGADHAFLYDGEGFARKVREATRDRGVDVVFDSVGKATLRGSMNATRVKGLVINYGNVSGSVRDLDPMELGEAGSLLLTRPRLADHMRDAATVQRRADAIFGALLDGTLEIPIASRHTLETVQQVHAQIEGRGQVGKAIVELARA